MNAMREHGPRLFQVRVIHEDVTRPHVVHGRSIAALLSQMNRIGRSRFVGQVTKLKRGRFGARDVASLARDMMLGSLRMNG